MKKIISLLIVTVLCIGLTLPVLAEEFVPSITDKGAPEIVTVKDAEGNDAIGVIKDAEGNVIGYLYEACLVITPVSRATTSTEIPDDAEELLLEKYADLTKNGETLPYDKFGADLDGKKMVIRDLFDVSWLCGADSGYVDHPDHPAEVSPKGVTVSIIFNLGVSKNVDVYTMSFKNGEWNPIVSTVNNGDGTVTCTFEDFCPVAMSVETGYNAPPAQTGDNSMIFLWIGLLAVATLALAALIVVPAVKKNH